MDETRPLPLTPREGEFLFQLLRRAQISGDEAEMLVVLKSKLVMTFQAGTPEKVDDAESERPD